MSRKEHAAKAEGEDVAKTTEDAAATEPYDPAAVAIETMAADTAVAEAEAKAQAEFEAGRPEREKATREAQEGASPR